MIKKLYELNKLYTLFFIRKVLNFGILQSKIIRVTFLGIALFMFAITLVGVYNFISDIKTKLDNIDFIIESYSLTVLLWTIIAVLIIKVVFSKSADFLNITENFPVTKQTITLSLFIFEFFVSLFFVSMISMSFVISILLNGYYNNLADLIVNIFYVNILAFLILNIMSRILQYLCKVIKIKKVFPLLNIMFLAICFIFMYKYSQVVIRDIVSDFLNHSNETSNNILFLNNALHNWGFWVTTILFISISFLLIFLIVIIPGEMYFPHSNYIKLLDLPNFISDLRIYIYATFRHVNMLTNIVNSYIFSLLLISINLEKYLLFPLLFVCFNSMYCFVQTSSIRYIYYNFKYSAVKDFILMLSSQIIVIYLSSIPLSLVYLFLNNGVDVYFIYSYIVITVSPVFLIMVGILMPPYEDNPFTVLTSLIIISVPIVFIFTVLAILNLGIVINVSIYLLMLSFTIFFSIYGLKISEKRDKHEESITSN